ncbi:hypothetical protein pb186bvf_016240 [Paramecium bursaria]
MIKFNNNCISVIISVNRILALLIFTEQNITLFLIIYIIYSKYIYELQYKFSQKIGF